MKTKLIFYLTAIIILINIFFKGGWDIWIQTLTHILTIILLCISISGNFLIPKIVLSLPFLMLLTGLVISCLNSVTPVTSLIYLYNYINYLLIFSISASYLSTEKYQKKIVKTVIFLGALTASLDLLYPVLFHTALFPNPNIKVGFFLVVIPLYFNLIINRWSKLKNLFFIPVLISFYNAHSSWGNVVLIFSIILYFLVVKKVSPVRDKLPKATVHIILVLMFAAIIYVLFKSPDDIINRLLWLKAGITMFWQRPLTGFGAGSTAHILPVFIHSKTFSLYVHSFFIQFAAENGIFSIFGLLWLLLTLLKKISVQNRIVFISMTGLVVYNLFEYNLSIPLIALILWFLSGSFARYKYYTVSLKKYIFISFFILFVFTLSIVIRPFISTRYFSKGIYNLRFRKLSSAEVLFNKSLKIFPEYYLPRLGLGLKNIFENDLKNAQQHIYLSFPIKEGNPVYKKFNEGVNFMDKNKKNEAKGKFLEVIRLRLIQYGLDPKEYML